MSVTSNFFMLFMYLSLLLFPGLLRLISSGVMFIYMCSALGIWDMGSGCVS